MIQINQQNYLTHIKDSCFQKIIFKHFI